MWSRAQCPSGTKTANDEWSGAKEGEATMRAWQITDWGFENLKIMDLDPPPLGDHEVRVQLRAVSLNYRDLLTVHGFYNPKQPLPLVPCSDGAGEVVEVGAKVSRFKVGDRVAGNFAQAWISDPPVRDKLRSTLGGPLPGMLSQERVLLEEGLVALPDHLSFVEGATLPCAALTAWSAVVRQGRIVPGSTVVCQGTGGVSLFALQFSKTLGARVILTSSSDEKLERGRALGADETINYKDTPQWSKRVRELTGKAGADLVIEVGGAGTFNQSARATRIDGTIALIGNVDSGAGEINLIPILMQNIRVQGVIVGSRDAFEEMNRALVQHRIKPVVDRVFPFENAPDAFEYLASQKHLGKVCIEVG
jgi:NADPH:quinone reductase-like Zn-dependent oxidoreductase